MSFNKLSNSFSSFKSYFSQIPEEAIEDQAIEEEKQQTNEKTREIAEQIMIEEQEVDVRNLPKGGWMSSITQSGSSLFRSSVDLTRSGKNFLCNSMSSIPRIFQSSVELTEQEKILDESYYKENSLMDFNEIDSTAVDSSLIYPDVDYTNAKVSAQFMTDIKRMPFYHINNEVYNIIDVISEDYNSSIADFLEQIDLHNREIEALDLNYLEKNRELSLLKDQVEHQPEEDQSELEQITKKETELKEIQQQINLYKQAIGSLNKEIENIQHKLANLPSKEGVEGRNLDQIGFLTLQEIFRAVLENPQEFTKVTKIMHQQALALHTIKVWPIFAKDPAHNSVEVAGPKCTFRKLSLNTEGKSILVIAESQWKLIDQITEEVISPTCITVRNTYNITESVIQDFSLTQERDPNFI